MREGGREGRGVEGIGRRGVRERSGEREGGWCKEAMLTVAKKCRATKS